jgi:hypothetical protein
VGARGVCVLRPSAMALTGRRFLPNSLSGQAGPGRFGLLQTCGLFDTVRKLGGPAVAWGLFVGKIHTYTGQCSPVGKELAGLW